MVPLTAERWFGSIAAGRGFNARSRTAVVVTGAKGVIWPLYDAVAPTFDRHRALPEGVADAIRSAILASIGMARPRVLDLGAGTGRIGWPFVSADDDYVGVDLSFGMLREFIDRAAALGSPRAARGPIERGAFAVSRSRLRRRLADPNCLADYGVGAGWSRRRVGSCARRGRCASDERWRPPTALTR